jgi:hypothetical protein
MNVTLHDSNGVASTIYFGGVLPIAPVGDNFKFTITQGGTTATYSALCVFDPTGGCEGNIDGSTVAFVGTGMNIYGTPYILLREKATRAC